MEAYIVSSLRPTWMFKLAIISAFIVLPVALIYDARAQTKWALVWSDEFDYTKQ